MPDQESTAPETNQKPSPKERFDVFKLVERENRPTLWQPFGSAGENKDGSMNVYTPEGRLNIRRHKIADRVTQDDLA